MNFEDILRCIRRKQIIDGNDIAKDLNIDEKDSYGNSLLYYSIIHQNNQIAKVLIEKGADINSLDNDIPIILIADQFFNQEIFDLLADKGADINVIYNGKPLIHWVALFGNAKSAEKLISKGCDIKSQCIEQRPPSYHAIKFGNKEILETFFNNGLSIDYPDHFKDTPLFHAVRNGTSEMVEFILTKGADVHYKNDQGFTALHFAIWHNDSEKVISMLLKKGADIDSPDAEGYTPLHWAARNRKPDTVKFLLDNGADYSLKNYYDETPASVTYCLLCIDILHRIKYNNMKKELSLQQLCQLYCTVNKISTKKIPNYINEEYNQWLKTTDNQCPQVKRARVIKQDLFSIDNDNDDNKDSDAFLR